MITRFCAPFPKYKKITKNDQIKIISSCKFGCTNSTTYKYKFYKNKNTSLTEYSSNIPWVEWSMSSDYFMGINNFK